MTLLITADELRARRLVAHEPLKPLALSLAADIEPLVGRELLIPPEKALLSREGGRCPTHGTLLEFDPASPRAHRCPVCGERFTGDAHFRFWIYWYQLWLAERATVAATLAALGLGDRFRDLARSILLGYADRYASYPNRDNVLGPTRLFFSTYVESIWLLQICIALDLLEESGRETIGGVIRDRIIEPSAAIIAGYDEGQSNRQVWNNAAMLAAARLLGTRARVEQIVRRSSGIAGHLGTSVLADGSWYEGENYHLFAHRGLWYGVTMAARAGVDLPNALLRRFDAGFMIPFATALPDLTMPSRRDSQYAISLRQWRIAEHCELGVARTGHPALRGALARLYALDIPRRATARRLSSADVERNGPASGLSRSDLSWRALLHAQPVLEAAAPAPARSTILEGQGIAVFRRDEGRAYAALDYGHSGGGHGHADRLNLLLVDGDVRWLDDMGTGSYVDPSLHWYRSTLAHNAPLVNGQSQARVHGKLLAYDDRAVAGWVAASAEVAPGVRVVRTIVMMPRYVIDEVEWRADVPVAIDLPLHVDARIVRGADALREDRPIGDMGLEDGFRFLERTAMQRSGVGATVELVPEHPVGQHGLRIWWRADGPAEWWLALAPGPPGSEKRFFRFVRVVGDRGVHRSVWSWAAVVAGVSFEKELTVTLADGAVHTHRRTDSGWHIRLSEGRSRSSILLRGWVPAEAGDTTAAPEESADRQRTPRTLHVGSKYIVDLGDRNYRRSEQSWREAGGPTASIVVSWTGSALRIAMSVHESDLTFVPAGAVNPYDNEPMEINGDGVQVYLRTARGDTGWLLVPDRDATTVRVRPIESWGAIQEVAAQWRPAGSGYEIDIELPISLADIAGPAVGLDVVINEKPADRERRRGQLVMSGAQGEFVYLRGDRHEAWRLVPFQLGDA
jgi:hypothetical protein